MDNQLSQSLQIQEPSNKIVFSSSEDTDKSDLDYSLEDPSLTFQLEDSRRRSTQYQKHRSSIQLQNSPILLNNQPPKRKRREIFDKYLKANQQFKQKEQSSEVNNLQDSDLMKTFDQIFCLNSQKNSEIQNKAQPTKMFKKKNSLKQQPLILETQFIKNNTIQQSKKDAKIEEKQKIKDEKMSNYEKDKQFLDDDVEVVKLKEPQSSDNRDENKFVVKSNFDKNRRKSSKIGQNDIFGLQDLEYRYSFIDGKENQSVSLESDDLAEILKSQIFNENHRQEKEKKIESVNAKQLEKLNFQRRSFPKDDYNEQPHESKFHNQGQDHPQSLHSINLYQESPKTFKRVDSQNNLNHEKLYDPYQDIDMSSSIASSILVKDTKYQKDSHFLGGPLDHFALHHTQSAKNLFIPSQSTQNIHKFSSMQSQNIDPSVPIFLRKVKCLNSLCPNFQHPRKIIGEQNNKLQQIISAFWQAITFLFQTLQLIRMRSAKMNEFYTKISKGITVQQFLSLNWSDWEKIDCIYKLLGEQNFCRRAWNQKKVEKALENYQNITEHYRKISLNLLDETGLNKYYDIRRKFWDVEKNIKMIGEDMYLHIMETMYPIHYYQFSSILHNKLKLTKKSAQILLIKIKNLRLKSESLSMSEVGESVIAKLKKVIKFENSY